MIEFLSMVEALKQNAEETIATSRLPEIIIGGMGVNVSNWELCKAAAIAGKNLGEAVLPIVSGTGLPAIMVDRLQSGDTNTIRALRAFDKVSSIKLADKIINKYPVRAEGERHMLPPRVQDLVIGTLEKKAEMEELTVVAAFVEIYLAKEGHSNPIGVNVLEKIQSMHLPTILGAMMAGVDYIAVGAGVPNQIPKLLEDYTEGRTAEYMLDLAGLEKKYKLELDPKRFTDAKLKTPKFFPIVAFASLAARLAKTVKVDGFIVTGNTPGHRANPRKTDEGPTVADGQSVYGKNDKIDLEVFRNLKDKSGNALPFWLAGAYADKLGEALALGAAGVQIGTVAALSDESGIKQNLKHQARKKIANASAEDLVKFTRINRWDSPTGFTFCVAQVEGTLAEKQVYEERIRSCSYGCLVEYFLKPDNTIGARCPAEPKNTYVEKGGKEEDADGRVCLCNALISAVDHAKGPSILTLWKGLESVQELMKGKKDLNYSIKETIIFVAKHR